jgi:hypothetical protein
MYGANVKKTGKAGIQYRSVRNENALCWGLMSPKHVECAIQLKHFEFVFNGTCIAKVSELVTI